MALPIPRGFFSPKKPPAAIRLEERQRKRESRAMSDSGHGSGSGYRAETETGSQERLDDRVVSIPASGNERLRSPETRGIAEHDEHDPQPTTPVRATTAADPSFLSTPSSRAGPNPKPESFTPKSTVALPSRPSHPDPDFRMSFTDASSPPQTHLPELSSDDLVRQSDPDHLEKGLSNGHAPRHGNGNGHPLRSAMVAKRSSGIRSAFRNSPEKGSSSNQDRSVQGQPTTTRYRRHEKFENPLQTWWCGGYLMSGGDNLWSFALALVVFLGITGVWIGTTGAWLWVHGAEYGLAKGGGVGIVVVFV